MFVTLLFFVLHPVNDFSDKGTFTDYMTLNLKVNVSLKAGFEIS